MSTDSRYRSPEGQLPTDQDRAILADRRRRERVAAIFERVMAEDANLFSSLGDAL